MVATNSTWLIEYMANMSKELNFYLNISHIFKLSSKYLSICSYKDSDTQVTLKVKFSKLL